MLQGEEDSEEGREDGMKLVRPRTSGSWEPRLGKPFASDDIAASRVMTVIDVLTRTSQTGPVQWKCNDGSWVSMTVARWVKISPSPSSGLNRR